MITKVERPPKITASCMSLAKIFAQDRAFYGSALQNDFWIQTINDRITAVVSADGGSANVFCDDADYEELSSFLQTLRPTVIFTEYENVAPLGLCCERLRNTLQKKCLKTKDAEYDFTLRELYDRLSLGSDVDIHLPSFEIFAPDTSHRLRHDGAVAVTCDYGAALAFIYNEGAVMTGIALAPEKRGQGLGGRLLFELTSRLEGDFFVAANDTNSKFYLKCGFTLSGRVCFCRMEKINEGIF